MSLLPVSSALAPTLGLHPPWVACITEEFTHAGQVFLPLLLSLLLLSLLELQQVADRVAAPCGVC
jgi:hypothetical protein